jgi:hypothetical protein
VPGTTALCTGDRPRHRRNDLVAWRRAPYGAACRRDRTAPTPVGGQPVHTAADPPTVPAPPGGWLSDAASVAAIGR